MNFEGAFFMKTFIPHVYFSAPEDTVGDLVNQIRRESEIPGTAEPKPEMKDSGKKSMAAPHNC